MINLKDNYSLFEENDVFQLAMISSVGGRPDQQDCSGYELGSDSGMIVICDGMGGHDGGRLASSSAVSEMLRLYNERDSSRTPSEFLMNSADSIDHQVSMLSYENGIRMDAGTTMICSVIIGDKLYYMSVGDSRIYLIRNDECYQLTVDHNYLTKLNMDLSSGKITQSQYEAGLSEGEALVSFIGIGGLSMIDCISEPITLSKDDRIVMTTDGMYKLIESEDIRSLINNFSNISEAVQALELKARHISSHGRIVRDNMTVAVIRIK